jgi:hypothetical protein
MGGTDRDHGIAEQNVAVNSTYVPDLDDKAMERRIVRKIDMHIMPWICISYLINYLDRACYSHTPWIELSQSRPLTGHPGQLGQRTNIEQRHPFGQHRHRARPHRKPLQHRCGRVFCTICVLRSPLEFRDEVLLSLCLDRPHHDLLGYHHDLHRGCLQLPGLTCHSIFPGCRRGRVFSWVSIWSNGETRCVADFSSVVMYLCYWYKPSERATRLAIFAGSVAVAGAFSGLLASG